VAHFLLERALDFDCDIDEDDLWYFCAGFIDYYKRHENPLTKNLLFPLFYVLAQGHHFGRRLEQFF
jgi:hypothetical protein